MNHEVGYVLDAAKVQVVACFRTHHPISHLGAHVLQVLFVNISLLDRKKLETFYALFLQTMAQLI
jgi:hypothetical protein